MAEAVKAAADAQPAGAAQVFHVPTPSDERILDMVRMMAKVAARDFSEKPALVDDDDPISMLSVGFRFMMEDLERTLGELERERLELQRANEQFKNLDRSKTRFINTAAHELGTPLTPIVLQLALLRQGAHGPLTKAQQDSLGMLERNMNRLTYLVQEMLDVARIQSGRMRLRLSAFDVASIARQCVDSFAEQAKTHQIQLRLDAPQTMTVEADENRITQVLFNLISNALKFTPAGGHVDVRVRVGPAGATVTVRDDGAGLEGAEIARLFQPFSQVHESFHGPRSGTGLGLFISKGIIELHGGRIGCESPGHGKGSQFQLWIPNKAPIAAAEDAAGADRIST